MSVVLGFTMFGSYSLPIAAFLGSLIATALIYLLSQDRGRVNVTTMLLSGIAIYEHCEGGMQLRTGKSGTYRSLTCANKANKGKLSCRGQSVRMDAVD